MDGEVTLVDVREDEEWAARHPAGAVHAALGTLPASLPGLPDGPLAFPCRTGARSVRVSSQAIRAGRFPVHNVAGPRGMGDRQGCRSPSPAARTRWTTATMPEPPAELKGASGWANGLNGPAQKRPTQRRPRSAGSSELTVHVRVVSRASAASYRAWSPASADTRSRAASARTAPSS
ncbi:rhodanese-like domain-containing protein [Streptomyces sp. NPDC059788]|uniref:rhodanese-like domain-containing protein n=1 Tax=Streptomyces sp. NPDC059788 TaxID=3346948 RepID=UPI003652D86B